MKAWLARWRARREVRARMRALGIELVVLLKLALCSGVDRRAILSALIQTIDAMRAFEAPLESRIWFEVTKERLCELRQEVQAELTLPAE